MADTLLDPFVSSQAHEAGIWGPYWSDISTGVIIYLDSDNDVNFARTTDKGATWVLTDLRIGTVKQISAWYDKETPGDTGTLVHVLAIDDIGVPDIVVYRTVDVATGSLGTVRTVDASITAHSISSLNQSAITKTVNGNLIAAFSTQAEIECYRSVDAGVNWVDIADVFETGTEEDYLFLFPADTADTADAAAIFWDRSASEISIKMWDNSAGTWTETSVSTGMTAGLASKSNRQMEATVRHSDNHILLAAWNDYDQTTADLKTFDLTVASITTPTVTAKTDVVTNLAESARCAMWINQQDDEVRVTYLKGGTWNSLVDCVFKISTDGMSIWGTEQAYSEAAADELQQVHAGRMVGNAGGRFQPVFHNLDLSDLYVNEVNDVEIAESINAISVSGIISTLTGALTKTFIPPIFIGTISTLVGALLKFSQITFTGIISTLIGLLTKIVIPSVYVGVISTLVGALTKTFIPPIFIGTITTLTGALTTILTKILNISGNISTLIGTLTNAATKILNVSGVISTLTGIITKLPQVTVTGIISTLTGALTTVLTKILNINGNISTLIGTFQTNVNKILSGTITSTSTLTKNLTISVYTGTISTLTGILTKLPQVTFNSTISTLIGTLTRTFIPPTFVGTLSTLIGLLTKAVTPSAYVGVISTLTGALTKTFMPPIFIGTISALTGALTNAFTTILDVSGTISTLTGNLIKLIVLNIFVGIINTLTGTLTSTITKVLNISGAISTFTGILTKSVITNAYVGVISTLTGALTNVFTKILTVNGTISTLLGTLTKTFIPPIFVGTLSTLTSTLIKVVTPSAYVGVISTLTSTLIKGIIQSAYIGTISTLTGSLTTLLTKLLNVSGNISTLIGTLTKIVTPSVYTGLISTLIGALTNSLSNVLNISGIISTVTGTFQTDVNKFLSGTITSGGTLTKFIQVPFSGNISSLVGNLIKTITFSLIGTISTLTGFFTRLKAVPIPATLTLTAVSRTKITLTTV